MEGRQKGAIQKLGGIQRRRIFHGGIHQGFHQCGIKFNRRGWRIYRTPSFDICTAAIKIISICKY